MIHIGKKYRFTFQKCMYSVFSHFHSKFAKSAITTKYFYFLEKKYKYGLKKRRMSNLKKCPCKQVIDKKIGKFWAFFVFTHFVHIFLFLLLFMSIFLIRHQCIWNQHAFRYPYWFLAKKLFWVYARIFCKLCMQMRKKLYVFKHLAKSKFFVNSYPSLLFLLKFQKNTKLKPA